MTFSDPAAVAAYADNVVRQVPGLHALHQMTGILLAERMPADGCLLVLGAGGGMELRAFARAHPEWQMLGVDPSPEMLALAGETLGTSASHIALMRGDIDAVPDIEFDGATCLLTLHFLSTEERLHVLRALRRRLAPGAPLVVAHHSVPDEADEKLRWFRYWSALVAENGVRADDAAARADRVASRLPTLAPDTEVELLRQAGFRDPSLFYAALTFRGWVAYA